MKSSSLFRRTTSVSHQRMTRWPPTSSTVEQRGRLQRRRSPSSLQQRLGRRAERRDQHQQRHDGEILEQQHAHHAAAVLALELEPVGHQLDDDRRRAHRQRAAERDRALPAEAPGAPGQRAEPRRAAALPATRGEHRQHDLAQAEAEDELAHAAQLRQVELEADHEHQEDDAELGQVADAAPRRSRERQRVRPDERRRRRGSRASAAGGRGGRRRRRRPRRPGRAASVRASRPSWRSRGDGAGRRTLESADPTGRLRAPPVPASPSFDAERALELARATLDIEARALDRPEGAPGRRLRRRGAGDARAAAAGSS